MPTRATARPKLLIFLHGVGSNGVEAARIARALTGRDEGFVISAPDAPQPFDRNPSGRQWFSLTDITEESRLERVKAALPALDAFIKAELARHDARPEDLWLAGFSQGAIMALSWIATGHECAGVLALSGRLPRGLEITYTKTPITLIHGTADPVIGIEHAREAHSQLQQAEINAALITLQMGHTISPSTLRHARRLLTGEGG